MSIKEIEELNLKLCSNSEANLTYMSKEINSLKSLYNNGDNIFFILKTTNKVLLPGLMLHFSLPKFERKLINILNNFHNSNIPIGLILKKCNEKSIDIYEYGTIANIIDIRSIDDKRIHLIIKGSNKFKISSKYKNAYIENDFFISKIDIVKEKYKKSEDAEIKLLSDSLKMSTLELLQKDPEFPQDAAEMINNNVNPFFLSYFSASITSMSIQEKQDILKENLLKKKIEIVLKHILKDIDLWKLRKSIKAKVYKGISEQQKEIYLRNEIDVIKGELGENKIDDDIHKYKIKCQNKKWSKEAKEHFNSYLKKLEKIPSNSPEYSVYLNHLDFFSDLPWQKFTKDNLNTCKAKEILSKSHYALKDPKERIYEYLSVLELRKTIDKSPILCFLGPPGVGKTSLGESIAKALNREYVRISLGAITDEADIRGHRKTYVGAMPGKPLNAIKKAGYSNPVILLDEIDKMGEYRGSPDSALLELLDPEQNKNFMDNFLEVPYDMSKVFFIATANSLENISTPLRDRMEIIEFSGYATEEKTLIAKKHILPEQLEYHGLKKTQVKFTDTIIEHIIENYTFESGVRSLKRKIAKILRKIAQKTVSQEKYNSKISQEDITNYLGPQPFLKDKYEKFTRPGISIGLAYTTHGGEILYIETIANKGKGEINISGQLGDIMKESLMAAISYLKSNAKQFNISPDIFEKYDLHIHLPDGATPKDGPSAGITLLVALTSLLTGRKVKEKISMSGELTLRGVVLPVGGIKEKILAAKRAGIKKIILSHHNKKDVNEIEKLYIKNLEFIYVNKVDDVINFALNKKKDTNAYQFN